MTKVKWEEFVKEAASLTGVSQKTIREGWMAISAGLGHLYKREEVEVSLPNVGKISFVYVPLKEGVSNLTGKKVKMGDKFRVKFTPYNSLKDAINEEKVTEL